MAPFNLDEIRFTGKHLYIHIPICRHRCDYCDFFTRVGVTPSRQEALIQRMSEQFQRIYNRVRSGEPETIYVGGGTPSALVPAAWNALLRMIEEFAVPVAEITVELNPEDVTSQLLEDLRNAGINRISLGVQTFSPMGLQTIGRHTTLSTTQRGLDVVATDWASTWSADIITAIPGQPVRSVIEDLTALLQYGPPHISLYELGIEPATLLGTRARRGELVPLRDETKLAHLAAGQEFLRDAGFYQYEISSFALQGHESRHNLAYWSMQPHLGVGPGAVGTYIPETSADMIRLTNTQSFQQFLSREDFGVQVEPIGRWDVLKELVMMGLRTTRGFDGERFRNIGGADFPIMCERTGDIWNNPFNTSGYGHFVLAREYWNVLDAILVDIFTDIDHFRSTYGTNS